MRFAALFILAIAMSPQAGHATDVNDLIAQKRAKAELQRKMVADTKSMANVPPGNHTKLDESKVKQAITSYSNNRYGKRCSKKPYEFNVKIISTGSFAMQLGGYPVKYTYQKKCGRDTIDHAAIDINIRIRPDGSYEAFKPKWVEDGEDEMSRGFNESMKKAFR